MSAINSKGWWRRPKESKPKTSEAAVSIKRVSDGVFTANLPNGCKWTFHAQDMKDAEKRVVEQQKKYDKRRGYSLTHIAFGGTNIRNRVNKS